jgi:hypothetical protein
MLFYSLIVHDFLTEHKNKDKNGDTEYLLFIYSLFNYALSVTQTI